MENNGNKTSILGVTITSILFFVAVTIIFIYKTEISNALNSFKTWAYEKVNEVTVKEKTNDDSTLDKVIKPNKVKQYFGSPDEKEINHYSAPI